MVQLKQRLQPRYHMIYFDMDQNLIEYKQHITIQPFLWILWDSLCRIVLEKAQKSFGGNFFDETIMIDLKDTTRDLPLEIHSNKNANNDRVCGL